MRVKEERLMERAFRRKAQERGAYTGLRGEREFQDGHVRPRWGQEITRRKEF